MLGELCDRPKCCFFLFGNHSGAISLSVALVMHSLLACARCPCAYPITGCAQQSAPSPALSPAFRCNPRHASEAAQWVSRSASAPFSEATCLLMLLLHDELVRIFMLWHEYCDHALLLSAAHALRPLCDCGSHLPLLLLRRCLLLHLSVACRPRWCQTHRRSSSTSRTNASTYTIKMTASVAHRSCSAQANGRAADSFSRCLALSLAADFLRGAPRECI